MIQKFYLKPWSAYSRQVQWIALAVGFVWFSATLPMAFLFLVTGGEEPFWVTLACAFAIVPVMVALFWMSRRYSDMEVKSFRIALPAAVNAIGHVLDEKDLPYQGQYHEAQFVTPTHALFRLKDSDLTIKLIENGLPPNLLVQVQIRPITVENRPLAKSLQQKIDRALLPHGLS